MQNITRGLIGGLANGLPRSDRPRAVSSPKDFNPLSRVVPGDPAAWKRAAYGDKTLANGVRYGGCGFLRLPDGRLVPLDIPQVQGKDGRWHSADDGPGGRVSTLDGNDPGWVRQTRGGRHRPAVRPPGWEACRRRDRRARRDRAHQFRTGR